MESGLDPAIDRFDDPLPLSGNPLSAGNFSTIYKVSPDLAIKIIRCETTRSLRECEHEANVLQKLKQLPTEQSNSNSQPCVRITNLDSVFAPFPARKQVFQIFLDYGGDSLKNIITCRNKTAYWKTLLDFEGSHFIQILEQMIEGLTWVHRCNIAHRQINADHLLLKREPSGKLVQLKIADFGASVTLPCDEDFYSDVRAISTMIYFMIYGRDVDSHLSPKNLVRLPEVLPSEIEAFSQWILSKRPTIQVCQDLIEKFAKSDSFTEKLNYHN